MPSELSKGVNSKKVLSKNDWVDQCNQSVYDGWTRSTVSVCRVYKTNLPDFRRETAIMSASFSSPPICTNHDYTKSEAPPSIHTTEKQEL